MILSFKSIAIPVHCLPKSCVLTQVGFVNSLAFANSGRFLIAGVGQVTCLSLVTILIINYISFWTFLLNLASSVQ